MPNKTVVLNSFEDLERFKQSLLEDISILEDRDVELSERFPKVLEIRLEGEKFHASLPTSVMEGLVDLQKGINHTYSVIKYGDRGKRLSQAEKNLLEFNVKVKEGSSLLSIDWTTIIEEAVTQMTGGQILFGAGMILVSLLISRYMGLRYKSIQDERETEFNKLQEQERNRTLTEVQKNTIEAIRTVSEIADETQLSSYKHFADTAESIQIGDTRVSSDELKEEIRSERRPRVEPHRSSIDGHFSVHELRFETEDTYVNLIQQETGEKYNNVRVQDAFITKSDFQIIQNAMDREPLHLRLIVSTKHDRIVDAVIDAVLSE